MNNNMRLALVEDNPGDVLLIQEVLRHQQLPASVTWYEDVPDAIAGILGDTGAAPDALLLDLNLPKGDGADVLRALQDRPELRRVPVAVITSSQSPEDRKRLEGLRVDVWISKPVTLDAFFSEVGSALSTLLCAPRATTA